MTEHSFAQHSRKCLANGKLLWKGFETGSNHSFTPNPIWQEGPALIQLDRFENDVYGERDTSEIELVP